METDERKPVSLKTVSLVAAMECMAAPYIGSVLPGKKIPVEKQCKLPGCEKTTTHRGGYCCAEHCRQHRQERKTRHD